MSGRQESVCGRHFGICPCHAAVTNLMNSQGELKALKKLTTAGPSCVSTSVRRYVGPPLWYISVPLDTPGRNRFCAVRGCLPAVTPDPAHTDADVVHTGHIDTAGRSGVRCKQRAVTEFLTAGNVPLIFLKVLEKKVSTS